MRIGLEAVMRIARSVTDNASACLICGISAAVLFLGALTTAGAGEPHRSYEELRRWIDDNRGAESAFSPGEKVGIGDRKRLESFIPISASERTSEMLGMDWTTEDLMGFGGKVYEHRWTYLGKKRVLATFDVRRQSRDRGDRISGCRIAPDGRSATAHVLLIEPKDPGHPYGRKILFIDDEHFWTLWMFTFDRQDELPLPHEPALPQVLGELRRAASRGRRLS